MARRAIAGLPNLAGRQRRGTPHEQL